MIVWMGHVSLCPRPDDVMSSVGKLVDGVDILLSMPEVAAALSEALVKEIEAGVRGKVSLSSCSVFL